ncbi:hypothetical protein AB9F41_19715 [Rhizobium leguminosarum]|uniref:hypothetical protein n=1 Tax=Rhizobium leguminosarum TaxID=384 RepID=UPI003F95DB7B
MSRGPNANSAAIVQAAKWLKSQRPPVGSAVDAAGKRFVLTKIEACEAVVLARGLKVWRGER